MQRLPRTILCRMLAMAVCLPLLASLALAQTAIRQVRVLGAKDAVEIEVEASDRIVPQTQVLSGPDRLVVDFPNAVPGTTLRSQSVERGDVKDIRFGLFQNNPPVTRLVLDLKSAQTFQVFPGRTVIIKVAGGGSDDANNARNLATPARPGLIVANYTTGAERIPIQPPAQVSIQPVVPQAKPLDVSFRGGLLTVHANKATLSEVLFAVQQRTGADIGIVAGTEQEKVVVDLGPAPAPEVIAQLLNGSRFNFLIVSSPNNPQHLEKVILSPRAEGMVVSRAPISQPVRNAADEDEETAQPAPPPPPGAVRPPIPGQPTQQDGHPEVNTPPTVDNPQ